MVAVGLPTYTSEVGVRTQYYFVSSSGNANGFRPVIEVPMAQIIDRAIAVPGPAAVVVAIIVKLKHRIISLTDPHGRRPIANSGIPQVRYLPFSGDMRALVIIICVKYRRVVLAADSIVADGPSSIIPYGRVSEPGDVSAKIRAVAEVRITADLHASRILLHNHATARPPGSRSVAPGSNVPVVGTVVGEGEGVLAPNTGVF